MKLIKEHDTYFLRKSAAHYQEIMERRMKRRLEDLSTTKKEPAPKD